MNARIKAYSVHLLTASGVVFAMLAIFAAVDARWSDMFFWLLVAFLVDGIDGPLARRFNVRTYAARYDGAIIDLIIDYLTYVFIPAFALFQSGLLGDLFDWPVLITITVASVIYFADSHMKTEDNSFLGWPGCWNMAAFVAFALGPPPWVCFAAALMLSAAMFLPLKFIHPVRTETWRPLSLTVVGAWTALALWTVLVGFEIGPLVQWGIAVTSAYALLAGIVQQYLPRVAERFA